MQAKNVKQKRLLSVLFLSFLSVLLFITVYFLQKNSLDNRSGASFDSGVDAPSSDGFANFQLSYWVDLGLVSNDVRGYWYDHRNSQVAILPNLEDIQKAKNVLREKMHGNQLYVIYHRQYEMSEAKNIFNVWRQSGVNDTYGPYIVPTLVLQNYQNDGCNFSDDELRDLLAYFKANINNKAIGVYDIYNTASNTKRNFCNQLSIIKVAYPEGSDIIRVGLQPGEPLISPFNRAVMDTYSGVSSGQTNALWETSCGFGGSPDAKTVLSNWVGERVNTAKVAYDFIVVAFDYSKNVPCGTDNFGEGDEPLPLGRNRMVHDLIVGKYLGGGGHKNWSGFSIDLKILDAHSLVKDGKENAFYKQIASGKAYTGYFSAPLNESMSIFDAYDGPELTDQASTACKQATFTSSNPVISSRVGNRVELTCTYEPVDLDCVSIEMTNGISDCKAVRGSSGVVTFSCDLPDAKGDYKYSCRTFAGSKSNCCAKTYQGSGGVVRVR